MDKMYEIAQEAKYRFLGVSEMQKIFEDEMYEIGQFLAEFEYDASMNAVITCLSTISIKTPAASNSTTKPMSPACAV